MNTGYLYHCAILLSAACELKLESEMSFSFHISIYCFISFWLSDVYMVSGSWLYQVVMVVIDTCYWLPLELVAHNCSSFSFRTTQGWI